MRHIVLSHLNELFRNHGICAALRHIIRLYASLSRIIKSMGEETTFKASSQSGSRGGSSSASVEGTISMSSSSKSSSSSSSSGGGMVISSVSGGASSGRSAGGQSTVSTTKSVTSAPAAESNQEKIVVSQTKNDKIVPSTIGSASSAPAAVESSGASQQGPVMNPPQQANQGNPICVVRMRHATALSRHCRCSFYITYILFYKVYTYTSLLYTTRIISLYVLYIQFGTDYILLSR